MFRVRDISKNDVPLGGGGGVLCPISLKEKFLHSPFSVLVVFHFFLLHLPPKLELNDVMVNSKVKAEAVNFKPEKIAEILYIPIEQLAFSQQALAL